MSTSELKLEIQRPGKEPEFYSIDPGVYTIGSDHDCRIQLNHDTVDDRHAILTVRDSEFWIEDLGSAHGTQINDASVIGRAPVTLNQAMQVGPFSLFIHAQGAPAPTPPPTTPPTPPSPPDASQTQVDEKEESAPAAAPPNPDLDQKLSIKKQIHKELVERMDIKRLTASHVQKDELSRKAHATLEKIVHDVRHKLPAGMSPEALIKEVYDEALGLGPLEDLLADDTVTEIMVNGHHQIYVEQNGKLTLTDKTFTDDNSVLAIIERIVAPIGRRIDESQPYVDARLPDGSRVNAIIHPLSLTGPCLTIRKFSREPFTDKDMIRFGTLTEGGANFLRICVQLRKNIVVSGGTGSGKTTFLNVLSGYLPTTDRIVTIEDAAELRLPQAHVIRLESRPPNIEGRGAIAIRDLVRNALRMRPDRIVVGECRGGEALDMLQAMNTGHDGSLTTVHANAPRDVVSRLETMVLMSGMDLPVRAIREQVASAIDMIAHESRLSDGSRKITKITEVMGLEGDQIVMQDIFEFKQTGVSEDGKVEGSFGPTGAVPTFLEDIAARGLTIDRSIFDPSNRE
jgi:pilus assembly protein CpaF